MTEIDKELLTDAFERMGPERVERMLVAFGPKGDSMSYCRCALGFAAGWNLARTHELTSAVRASPSHDFLDFLAAQLGITVEQAVAIEDAHLGRNMAGGSDFPALAGEWLEQNRVVLAGAASAGAVQQVTT